MSAEAQAEAFEEQSAQREAVGGKAQVGGCGPRALQRGEHRAGLCSRATTAGLLFL